MNIEHHIYTLIQSFIHSSMQQYSFVYQIFPSLPSKFLRLIHIYFSVTTLSFPVPSSAVERNMMKTKTNIDIWELNLSTSLSLSLSLFYRRVHSPVQTPKRYVGEENAIHLLIHVLVCCVFQHFYWSVNSEAQCESQRGVGYLFTPAIPPPIWKHW